MASPKSRSGEGVPCDFCTDQPAVLYCKADSAKLCLFCDQHVHSANLLSRKHVRSQICDNCASEPVSVRCSTDNLVLCQECDWDAHGSCSVSAAHDRTPLEGFSGCPSALQLASLLGLDLHDKNVPGQPDPQLQNWDMGMPSLDSSWSGMGLQDLMVPNHNQNGVVYPNDELMVKRQSAGGISGKQKQGIQKQLVELLKRDLDGGGGGGGGCGDGGENLVVPRTPTSSAWQEDNGNGNVEGLEPLDLGNRNGGVDGVVVSAATSQPLLQQQAPFTSLLMMPEENRGIVDGDMLWNSNPHGQSSEIWDFHLGRSRDHEESGPLEVTYGSNDSGFMIKNFGELMKETSLTDTKMFRDLYQMNCPVGHDDIKFSNNSNNPTPSQGPATSESNNIPVGRPSLGSAFGEDKGSGASTDLNFMEQSFLMRGDNLRTVGTKADMELLAQNRGNAMLRYKEKKKTRRLVLEGRTASRHIQCKILQNYLTFTHSLLGKVVLTLDFQPCSMLKHSAGHEFNSPNNSSTLSAFSPHLYISTSMLVGLYSLLYKIPAPPPLPLELQFDLIVYRVD